MDILYTGGTVDVIIPITNKGPNVVDNVEVTVVLPSAVSYNADSPSIGTYTSGTGVWAIPQLIKDQSAILTLTLDVDNDCDLPQTVTWSVTSASETDPVSGNDSSSDIVGADTCCQIFPCLSKDGSYDNTSSGLTATSVQGAIDEIMSDHHTFLGVAAALGASDTTTITTAGTYYPINGTFTNTPIQGFSLQTEAYGPVIQYDGTETLYFEIEAHAAASADSPTTTVKGAIKKNNVLVTDSIMTTYMQNSNQLYAFSGISVVELSTGDNIQMTATSDGDGDVITFENLNATIRRFF